MHGPANVLLLFFFWLLAAAFCVTYVAVTTGPVPTGFQFPHSKMISNACGTGPCAPGVHISPVFRSGRGARNRYCQSAAARVGTADDHKL